MVLKKQRKSDGGGGGGKWIEVFSRAPGWTAGSWGGSPRPHHGIIYPVILHTVPYQEPDFFPLQPVIEDIKSNGESSRRQLQLGVWWQWRECRGDARRERELKDDLTFQKQSKRLSGITMPNASRWEGSSGPAGAWGAVGGHVGGCPRAAGVALPPNLGPGAWERGALGSAAGGNQPWGAALRALGEHLGSRPAGAVPSRCEQHPGVMGRSSRPPRPQRAPPLRRSGCGFPWVMCSASLPTGPNCPVGWELVVGYLLLG